MADHRIGCHQDAAVELEACVHDPIGAAGRRLSCHWGIPVRYQLELAAQRCSWALSSGVTSAPKSDASNTWRISISESPSSGFGQRLTHSIASSKDFVWNSQ